MTDREKLEKIKTLADKMYSRMAYLTSDTRPIRQAMDEYHQFIINEYHKEEPVSEKECMYSKDNYTAEDRKVLCEGCEEKCKFNKKEEPVSEDLYTVAKEYANNITEKIGYRLQLRRAVCFGVKWHKEHLIANAVDAVVKVDAGGYPYIDRTIELYDYDKDIPLAKKGDKYKVILIKED